MDKKLVEEKGQAEKADGHKESAGIHLVTLLEMIRRIVLMYLVDLS